MAGKFEILFFYRNGLIKHTKLNRCPKKIITPEGETIIKKRSRTFGTGKTSKIEASKEITIASMKSPLPHLKNSSNGTTNENMPSTSSQETTAENTAVGKSYKRFVRKRTLLLVKYQSQSEVIKGDALCFQNFDKSVKFLKTQIF